MCGGIHIAYSTWNHSPTNSLYFYVCREEGVGMSFRGISTCLTEVVSNHMWRTFALNTSVLLQCRLVPELHTPYVFPQECGGRAGVRWLRMAPSAGQDTTHTAVVGLQLVALNNTSWQMNVSMYGVPSVAAAHHQHELVRDARHAHVHLDVAHIGVGGDDSWSPSVHEQYLVPPLKYTLAVQLCAL